MTTCTFIRLFRTSHPIRRYYCSSGSIKEPDPSQKPPGQPPKPPDKNRDTAQPSDPPPQSDDHHPQETISPPTRVFQLVSKKVSQFVERYENRFKKKSPKLFDVYRTVKCFRYLAVDAHTYAFTSTDIWLGKELHTFTRKELETYLEMPSQFMRIIPLLVFGSIPVVGNLGFAIAYYFPKHLLTYQFWTDEQRLQFGKDQLKHRRTNLPHILKDMQAHMKRLEGTLQQPVSDMVKKIEQSSCPSAAEILASIPSFTFPYALSLERLSTVYYIRLGKAMNLSRRKSGLKQDGLVFLYIDRAMVREGFDDMTSEDIQKSCFRRGLDPNGLSRQQQIDYLTTWCQVSSHLDENSISLLLHLPVLLTYSQSTTTHDPETKKPDQKR